MPKRKVIEDSDDEDGAEPSPQRQSASTLSRTDAIDQQDVVADGQDIDTSTGSTDVLNREIRAAHESLIEATPDESLRLGSTRKGFSSGGKGRVSQGERGSSQFGDEEASPSMSRGKMKRAKTGLESKKGKKVLKRYGSESRRDIFEFRGSSEGEEDDVGRKMGNSWEMATGQTIPLDDRDQFEARHSPMGTGKGTLGSKEMLPPPSRSLSQTQTSRSSTTVMTRDDLHAEDASKDLKDVDTSTGFEATSSESRMPDPTMSSRGQGDEYTMEDSNNGMKDPGELQGLKEDANTSKGMEPILSASFHFSSKTSTSKRSDHSGGKVSGDGEGEADELSTILFANHPVETINPRVLLPNLSNESERIDELSLPSHGPDTWSINQTSVSKARQRKSEDIHIEEPGSDDVTIGLPKDQYQPRPSRSRSGQANEEVVIPVDFSKKPEAVAKRKRKVKRSKTTAFHELRPKDEDEEEEDLVEYKPTMEIIKEIPFQKSRESPKYEASKPEVELDQDEEIEEQVKDYKSAETLAQKKKPRGRPKKIATEASETRTSAGDINTTEESEPKDPIPPTKAKRGRKPKQAPMAISEELVVDSEDEPGDVDDVVRNPTDVLNETQGNSSQRSSTHSAMKTSSPVKDLPAKPTKTPPETPRKPITPAGKGPDKHSPISSSAVAYRVGLSKRARIAPLLRIVRK